MKVCKSALIFLVILTAAGHLSAFAEEELFKYDSKGKRDPFFALIGPNGEYLNILGGLEADNELKVEGIIWDPKGESFVVINAHIFKKGDIFEGVRVDEIYSNKVILFREEENEKIVIDLMKAEEKDESQETQSLPDSGLGSF